MKKFIIGFLIGAMIFGTAGYAVTYVAQPATFKVMINGKEFVSDPPALVVEGRTYLPLRAMGDALGVPVEWNTELNQAEVGITSNVDLSEVDNYVVGKVWNDGFWWVRNYLDGSYTYYTDMYVSTFAESADEEFNINKITDGIKSTKATMDLCNNFLKGNAKWTALYNEYNRLYELVEKGTFTEENFDTTFFEKRRDEFSESIR